MNLKVSISTLLVLLCTLFKNVHAQHIFIDTITYEGTIQLNKTNIRYKNIKMVVGAIQNNFKVKDPEIDNPMDETLLLFNAENKCILNFKLNEVVGDHNNATITTTDCNFTDTLLHLTRYTFFTDDCGGCSGTVIGIEKFTYQLNTNQQLVLKDSVATFTNQPHEKLDIDKNEITKFRKNIKSSPYLNKTDKQKILMYLKEK
jgi:hypothetical protein